MFLIHPPVIEIFEIPTYIHTHNVHNFNAPSRCGCCSGLLPCNPLNKRSMFGHRVFLPENLTYCSSKMDQHCEEDFISTSPWTSEHCLHTCPAPCSETTYDVSQSSAQVMLLGFIISFQSPLPLPQAERSRAERGQATLHRVQADAERSELKPPAGDSGFPINLKCQVE